MTQPTRSLQFLLALLLLAASGCKLPQPSQEQPPHAILLVSDGETVQPERAAAYDFGPAVVGTRVSRRLVLRNGGRADLQLESVEVLEGDAALVGFAEDSVAVFRLPFTAGTRLPPGGEYAVDVSFAPQPGAALPADGRLAVRVRLHTTGPRAGEETATLSLTGQAVVPECAVPTRLAFGAVLVGGSSQRAFEVHNPTVLPATAHIGDISGADAAAFTLSAESARGSTPLAAGASARVALDFHPTETRPYTATLQVRVAESCPELPVELVGRGVDALLTWTVDNAEDCTERVDGVCRDRVVDCGNSAPGTLAAERHITFTNVGERAILLSQLAFSSNEEEFFLIPAPGAEATRLEVPAADPESQKGGQATLVAGCRPMAPGVRTGLLSAVTDLVEAPGLGPIPFTVFGGGPQLEVSPGALDFGLVAHVAGATTPLFEERQLVLRNAGTAPPDAGPHDSLHLGRWSETTGTWEQPFVEVVPGENTGPGEFEVSVAAGHSLLEKGLPAGGQAAVWLTVRLTPGSPGPKQATLRLSSNGVDGPVTEVVLSAHVEAFSPCAFSLTPAPSQALDFGVVEAGNRRELVARFINTGSSECLLSGVQLVAGSSPAFQVEAAATAAVRVAPGAVHPLRVLLSLEGASPVERQLLGTLRFQVSSPESPVLQVPVRALVASSCVALFPQEVHFGTVQSGCGSEVRSLLVHNICQQEVQLLGVDLVAPAGLPAGVGTCSGSEGCPEFLLVQSPAVPVDGLRLPPGAAPLSVAVRYSPLDVGPDVGALRVRTRLGPAGVERASLFTLHGTGAATEGHTDRFHRELQARSDVLFVVDNSGSMQEKHDRLITSAGAFFQEALAGGTDLHVGVITTDMDTPTDSGRLRAVPSSGVKVLSSASPNLHESFAQLISSLETNGSGVEMAFAPALQALTAPLLTTANAGFLRPDALLTVLVVTDEMEGSDMLSSTALHRFLNIKGAHQAHRFSFHALASFDGELSGCFQGGVDDGRYDFMVRQTGGVHAEVCAEDWQAPLREMGRRVAGQRLTYTLTSTPVLDEGHTLQVTRVDASGQRHGLPETDGSGTAHWSYEPSTRVLTLAAAQALQPGESLEVHYTPVCSGP